MTRAPYFYGEQYYLFCLLTFLRDIIEGDASRYKQEGDKGDDKRQVVQFVHARCLVLEFNHMVASRYYHGAEYVIDTEVFGRFAVDVGPPIGSIVYFTKHSQPVAGGVRCVF